MANGEDGGLPKHTTPTREVELLELLPGRHELRTRRLDAQGNEPRDYVIPFWR